MLFNSFEFIFIFVPVVLIGYYALLKFEKVLVAKAWLFVGSVFFYGYWNPKYIFLILASILANYTLCHYIVMDKQKKLLFWLGLIFNLGLLGYFKYMDFFIENTNVIFGTEFHLLRIILPLGISFFTLQQIAYLVDTYTGLVKDNKFIDYSLFVCFFPQLIAGPIVHYREVIPQFEASDNKKFNYNSFSVGIYIFVIGLFKKVIIADTFAGFANVGFDEKESLHFFLAWGTSLSYAFQIYFDFSGYSDMAIGLGRLFNIKIPRNFFSPYKAFNIVDFWSRWHITLTNFITAYVFTPLVRSMPKMSFGYMMLSMFIAMTIAGLWHGAAWTFVWFGVLHGSAIVCHHNWKKLKKPLPSWLAWLLTFNFVNICFTMFRATSVEAALKVYRGMFGFSGIEFPKGMLSNDILRSLGVKVAPFMNNDDNIILLLILVSFFIVLKLKNSMELLESFKPEPKVALWTAGMFVLCLFGLNRLTEFIYFNF